MTTHDERFEDGLRMHWRQAAAHLPAGITRELRLDAARRRGAMPGAGANRAWPAMVAMASLALVMLALAPALREPATVPGDPATAAVTVEAAAPATALEASPDFFAWLGSDDPALLAMEASP